MLKTSTSRKLLRPAAFSRLANTQQRKICVAVRRAQPQTGCCTVLCHFQKGASLSRCLSVCLSLDSLCLNHNRLNTALCGLHRPTTFHGRESRQIGKQSVYGCQCIVRVHHHASICKAASSLRVQTLLCRRSTTPTPVSEEREASQLLLLLPLPGWKIKTKGTLHTSHMICALGG